MAEKNIPMPSESDEEQQPEPNPGPEATKNSDTYYPKPKKNRKREKSPECVTSVEQGPTQRANPYGEWSTIQPTLVLKFFNIGLKSNFVRHNSFFKNIFWFNTILH